MDKLVSSMPNPPNENDEHFAFLQRMMIKDPTKPLKEELLRQSRRPSETSQRPNLPSNRTIMNGTCNRLSKLGQRGQIGDCIILLLYRF
ncbi:hypothetical protein V6N12_049086 [Hibiscus sabdariffa]|uniref:Uncharacterized protein n=1 Tax=Hibiscus sabdariffa TaxID=183260 RepID=A0ABR2EJ49_9ROSI